MERHPDTGILQPAYVDSATLEESCFGDPCSLSVVEKMEAEDRKNRDKKSVEPLMAQENESEESGLQIPRKKFWERTATLSCLVILVAEAVIGSIGGSIACVTDALRLLSDYLGQRALSEKYSTAVRRFECVLLLFTVLLLWGGCGILATAATNRIIKKNFPINETYMLIGAVFSLTANCILLIKHFVQTFGPRKYLAMCAYISTRAQQVVHAVGNHGTSLIVFVAAVLIKIQPKWKIIDSISSYVLIILVICNTASIINSCCASLRTIGFLREKYQQI